MSSVAYLLKLGENLFYYFEEINIFLKMQILIILYADISDECFYTYKKVKNIFFKVPPFFIEDVKNRRKRLHLSSL